MTSNCEQTLIRLHSNIKLNFVVDVSKLIENMHMSIYILYLTGQTSLKTQHLRPKNAQASLSTSEVKAVNMA